jgi:hypothetical protein
VYSDDEAVENMHSLDEEEVGAGLYLQVKNSIKEDFNA